MLRDDTIILKQSASTKSKSYSCLVELAEPVSLESIEALSKLVNLEVAQRNPTRVPRYNFEFILSFIIFNRRADLVRSKVIENMTLIPIKSNDQGVSTIRIHLKTSAGTYVKEFIHGDNGRTEPSLASLLGVFAAHVLELDVLEVHLDWPPPISI